MTEHTYNSDTQHPESDLTLENNLLRTLLLLVVFNGEYGFDNNLVTLLLLLELMDDGIFGNDLITLLILVSLFDEGELNPLLLLLLVNDESGILPWENLTLTH